MAKNNHNNSFWTSYSDLMTSMFFIMLTLFVLIVIVMHNRMKATEYELNAIKAVIESTKELEDDPDSLFIYKPKHKKYVLNVPCHFEKTKTDFIDLQTDTAKLHKAGDKLRDFLQKHVTNNYLLIIEGQASRNSQSLTSINYDYSFKRALTLMGFWKDSCRIDFGNNCEIQIAGSGDGRYNLGYTGKKDIADARFKELETLLLMREANEPKNQRYIIQIIPKNIVKDNSKQIKQ